MKFCNYCKNLLNINTTTGNLIYDCSACGSIEQSNDDDSLLYSIEFKGKKAEHKFNEFIQNVTKDPTTPIIKKRCEKCSSDYMKYIRIGVDSELIYICSCGSIYK